MSHNVKKRSFSQSAAALIVFDAGADARARAWSTAETAEDIAAATRADALALRAVQDAYHRDTSDINSLANCHRVDVDFVRRMAGDSAPAVSQIEQPDADQADDQADDQGDDQGDDQADAPAPR